MHCLLPSCENTALRDDAFVVGLWDNSSLL